jgi:hypothetical protein
LWRPAGRKGHPERIGKAGAPAGAARRLAVGLRETSGMGGILKFFGSVIGIIFLIGLLVVIGLFMLIF